MAGGKNDRIIIIAVVSVAVIVLAAAGFIVFSKGSKKKQELKAKSNAARQNALKSGATKLQAEKQAVLATVSAPEKLKVEKEIEKITAGKTEAQAVKAVQEYQKKKEEESGGILSTLSAGVSETVKDVKETAEAIVDKVLDKEQEVVIQKLNPAVRQKFRSLITAIERLGYKVVLTSGYRDLEKQASLKSDNKSNAKAGFSPHNYGIAIDLNLYKGGKHYKKATPRKEWEATGVPALAESMGFRWGGKFSGYEDNVHFDLANKYNTAQLHTKAIAQFGTNPANFKGNTIALT